MDWSRNPLILGVLACVGGFFFAGWLGAAVGVLAGVVTAFSPRVVLAGAASALVATAAFALFEGSLSIERVSSFTDDRESADLAGAIAGVLVFAGLLGVLARDRQDQVAPSLSTGGHDAAEPPVAPVAALAAGAVLAALVLWWIGDGLWQAIALPLAIVAIVGGIGLVWVRQSRSRRGVAGQ